MNRPTVARSLLMALTLATLAVSAAAQDVRVAPANNLFANRSVISPRALMNGHFPVDDAQDAGIEETEPEPTCGSSGNIFDTVWYEFTAPHQIQFTVDTFESSLNNSPTNRNTVIAVYNSTVASPTLSQLTEVVCSENGTNQGFFTWYPLAAGKYYLQVGSSSLLSSESSYVVDFGSRYQLLTNTGFGEASAVLAPWTVINKTSDKVVCDVVIPRIADLCSFRFKVSPAENSILTYKVKDLDDLPHDTGPTNYSTFLLNVDHFTERALTDAKAMLIVKFSNGTQQKDQRSLDQIGAIEVDPLSGTTPTKAIVKVKHTGTSGKPLYILLAQLFYAPGATGRDVLPLPPAQ